MLLNSMDQCKCRLFLKTAKEIWDALREMYSHEKNITRVYELYENLFSRDRSLSDYYATLKGMWEELNIYQPLSADIQKQREEFQVAK